MIISHSHKFISFAIPKTGTHAVRFALRPFLEVGDEEQVALFHHSKLQTGDFQKRKNGHITALEIKPHLSPEIWTSYLKFAFMRNPYERFVSACFFKHPLLAKEHANTTKCRAYMKLLIQRESNHTSLFFRPQCDYIMDEKGKLMVDFIAQTENMDKDLESIFFRLNLPFKSPAKINSSNHLPYMAYYDDELRSLISRFYKKDFEQLKTDDF
ncbi:sulfotransferase family 2 domain-containing protein [uncultured Cyclobacterium sp.]|uniref:sulfotransferase family 2 domain-containing protein n=1 Tax=uncultured Cyclobacterium sp. TaxID=453820 RepID=UPI0030EB1981|tara:strand:+ start:80104 stop:80739 length:636 start_codon:yes stop_codon:yes gene_type:complete